MVSRFTRAITSAAKRGITDWSFINGQSALSWVPRTNLAMPMTKHVLSIALIASSLIVWPSASFALTPFNTPITNTATANYSVSGTAVSSSGSVTVTTTGRTPPTIEFLQYSPSGSSVQVEPTQCGGALTFPANSATPASTAVPGLFNLALATAYTVGDPVFVRVTDTAANLSATTQETITITVTTPAPANDSETLTLKETGVNTGVFVGFIQSAGASPASTPSNSCVLNGVPNKNVGASYTDITTVAAAALFDPFGIVFDSSTGQGVDGATVTLINSANNLPASVFCDDGVTVLTQPVTSGTPTCGDPEIGRAHV